MISTTRTRLEALTLSLAITMAAMALPTCAPVSELWHSWQQPVQYKQVLKQSGSEFVIEQTPQPSPQPSPLRWASWLTYPRYADGIMLLLGLALTIPCLHDSGLRIGHIRAHWRKVLLIIGGPLLLTAIVYPQLSIRPFANTDLSIWLISPLAQDLIFGGTVYRILRPHFNTFVHPKIPVEWVLPVGAVFFAMWHIQNFAYMPAGYVCFQLLYTWAAFTLVGLTRQWTGSLYYVTVAHMTGNAIVWFVK